MEIKRALRILAVVGILSPGGAYAAPIIQFEATDLANDPLSGEDLWQYAFTVSGWDFEANQAFRIFFSADLYANLSAPTTANADWDILLPQPQPDLTNPPGDPGEFNALSLTGSATIDSPFFVSFAWLGVTGAAPGVQPFLVTQYDEFGIAPLADLASGTTTSLQPVPEPSTLFLMTVAGAALAARRLRRSPR